MVKALVLFERVNKCAGHVDAERVKKQPKRKRPKKLKKQNPKGNKLPTSWKASA
jgi:hypothetical protein